MTVRSRRSAVAEDPIIAFPAIPTVAAEPTTEDGVDLYAVERALTGEYPPVQLTPQETRVAWSLVDDGQIWASELAELLGVTSRTVVRWRAARRTAGAS